MYTTTMVFFLSVLAIGLALTVWRAVVNMRERRDQERMAEARDTFYDQINKVSGDLSGDVVRWTGAYRRYAEACHGNAPEIASTIYQARITLAQAKCPEMFDQPESRGEAA